MKARIVGDSVAEAARKIGVGRARVYRLIERGRIRVLDRGQPRDGGRFAGHGMILDREDVEREAELRR